LFPEFAHRLDIYQNCCDKSGRIVKNHDYYTEYNKKDHKHGKRGGVKTVQKNSKKEKKDPFAMKID
jgi:hypothetical protein